MADSKITALTALTAADPANDMFPVVDVSDTTMAASGTTKRISINNILACSPSATLASATITGDLTVDTSTLKVDSANDRVGIKNAAPSFPLDLTGTGSNTPFRLLSGSGTSIRFDTSRNVGGANRNWIFGCDEYAEGTFALAPSTALGGATFTNPVYTVTSGGIHTFLDGAGGTRMTLNSTGLGVGVAPVYKFQSVGIAAATSSTVNGSGGNLIGALLNSDDANSGTNPGVDLRRWTGTALNHGLTYIATNATGDTLFYNGTAASNTRATSLKMTLDALGNLILLSPSTPPTLATNGQLTVNATSNTNLRFSYRGSDGTTRVANITLA